MNEHCKRCGHDAAHHIESGPNGAPWCRGCYGNPQLHKRRNHEFEE